MDKGLVINTTDKGSTIVIQDRTDYIHNGETKHLNNRSVYQPLTSDHTKNTITKKYTNS